MLAVAPLIGAATMYRVGVGHLKFWSQQTPALTNLWLEAWDPTSAADDAADKFRAQLIAAARESTRLAVSEVERGIDDVDAWAGSRSSPETSADASQRAGPRRA